jgi:DNA-binding NtrC family response regulator
LISRSDEIGNESIILQDSTGNMPFGQDLTTKAAQTAEAMTRGLVGRTVSEVEKRLIIDTLDHCLGNRTHAAKILGISIRTLRNKLNEYILDGTIEKEFNNI